jgi:pimeloyl-ACP methyl ester carboxylesterase
VVVAAITGVACESLWEDADPFASPPTTASSPPSTETTPSTTAAPDDEAGTIAWTDCTGGECGTLAVPLDHDRPDGETIDITLYRVPAGDPDERIGSLFLNFGGPGVSGVEFLQSQAPFFLDEITDRFDLVAVDGRGTGGSVPVQCVDSLDDLFAHDSSPDTGAERRALAAADADLAAACQEQLGDALGYLSTVDSARDMDLVRAALGEDQMTYLGYSYGSQIGSTYADLFPDRVRAFVLDGGIDPSLSSLEANLGQLAGFERSLDVFLEVCAAEERCAFFNDGDPGRAFDALAEQIDAEPIEVGDRLLGPAQFEIGVANTLYAGEAGWGDLAEALADAQDGDGEALLDQFDDYSDRASDGSYDPSLQAFWAIGCLDSAGMGGVRELRELEDEFLDVAPRFGRNWLYGALICSEWPVPPRPAELPIDAPGSAPILVIGTTGDPATPFEQAVALAEQLDSGVLLTNEGEEHLASPGFGINPCADEIVIAYLVDLEVPAEGTECPG